MGGILVSTSHVLVDGRHNFAVSNSALKNAP
jgi:hypothetical protein